MFQSGMKESTEGKIVINHIEYDIFHKICLYLYTGDSCILDNCDLSSILKILEVSDEFMLDEVKYECENRLVALMNKDNICLIYEKADLCNCI